MDEASVETMTTDPDPQESPTEEETRLRPDGVPYNFLDVGWYQ
jgi:hypothetical protein